MGPQAEQLELMKTTLDSENTELRGRLHDIAAQTRYKDGMVEPGFCCRNC
jgi:hypothetical protein